MVEESKDPATEKVGTKCSDYEDGCVERVRKLIALYKLRMCNSEMLRHYPFLDTDPLLDLMNVVYLSNQNSSQVAMFFKKLSNKEKKADFWKSEP